MNFRFSTIENIEFLYCVVNVIISILGIIGVSKNNTLKWVKVLSVIILPITVIITLINPYMIPLLLASIIIIFITKSKACKIVIISIFILPVLFLVLLYSLVVSIERDATEIVEKIYSPNKEYVAVIEEIDLNAVPGGEVNVFIRPVDSNKPSIMKYRGDWGFIPKVEFKDNNTILIDGKTLNIYDKEFIDEKWR